MNLNVTRERSRQSLRIKRSSSAHHEQVHLAYTYTNEQRKELRGCTYCLARNVESKVS